MMARPASEWDEGLPAEKALAPRPGPSLHSEKVAGHLAPTMLLMHRAPTRLAEKELDSTRGRRPGAQ